MRYARPEFLDEIAARTPLPMVVDGELGMPLDLSQWDCLWEENGDDSGTSHRRLPCQDLCSFLRATTPTELNPDPSRASKLDPLDQFLLGDPASTSTPFLGPSTPGISTPSASMPHVAWLRKTEYLSRENASRASLSQDMYVLPVSSAPPYPFPIHVYPYALVVANKIKTTRSISRATPKCATSTRPLPRSRTQTSRPCGIPPSPSSPPLRSSRSSRTQRSGRTRTICFASPNDQETGQWTSVSLSICVMSRR